MTSSSYLEFIKAIFSRPGYREYLKHKLLVRRGWVAPDHRFATLRLPDQRERFSATGEAYDAHTTGRTSEAIKVRDLLFERSPYENFEHEQHPEDLQGWGSDDPVLVDAIRLMRPQRVCEVGSWKGRSAIQMARAIKALKLHTEIVCVDTWLGSPEHWTKKASEFYYSLRILNGMPRLYFTFLANVVRARVEDVITPFPMTSENAAEIFRKMNIKFDIVYVDAAHEYGPAKRDLSAYYDLLTEDGIVVVDDYATWDGVTRAVDDLAAERQLRVLGVKGKAVIPKGKKYENISFG
jgi:predicted O-methyltransferase YrrM